MGDSLHTIELGTSGSRVVFCHGLFGQGRNFTAIGKALADLHRVTLVDMPDHGQSPWSDHFDYLAAGQKNLAGFDGTTIGYDFAVSEECGRYDECRRYVDDFGDQVLMIEYRFEDFAETCTAYGATHAVVLRDRELTPAGVHGWC